MRRHTFYQMIIDPCWGFIANSFEAESNFLLEFRLSSSLRSIHVALQVEANIIFELSLASFRTALGEDAQLLEDDGPIL
jgi:hypothetical protein